MLIGKCSGKSSSQFNTRMYDKLYIISFLQNTQNFFNRCIFQNNLSIYPSRFCPTRRLEKFDLS